MGSRDINPENTNRSEWEKPGRNRSGGVMGGLLLIGIGAVLIAAKLNALFLPSWVFSWQMFLIVLGLFLGFRHSFQKPGWIVLVLIGTVFLLNEHYELNLKPFFWPILIISLGLWLILRPKRRFAHHYQTPVSPAMQAGPQPGAPEQAFTGTSSAYTGPYDSAEDYIDSTAIFGGIKKNIISKRFKGGDIVNVFGGTELNMTQADMEHPVVLEATQIFGGTTLIVPPHWQIKSEMVAIMGGIDDKRPALAQGHHPNKVLILKGTTLFGGLNIKSY